MRLISRWFTEKTLRKLLENAGYRVDEWRVTCGNWMPEYARKRPFRWNARIASAPSGEENDEMVSSTFCVPVYHACQHS